MSMRIAQSIRPVARLAHAQSGVASRAVARRAASTSSGTHTAAPKSNDTPWMIGSAVVFGSLGAFLLYPSKADVHSAVHDTTHAQVRAEINESAPTVKQGEAVQARDTLFRDVKSEDPKETHPNADRPPSSLPAKKDQLKTMDDRNLNNEGLQPEKKSGGQNASDVAKSQAAGEGDKEAPSPSGSEEKSEDKSEDKSGSDSDSEPEQAKGKEEGEPTQQEIKESILRAERTNTPRAAMSEESKGNETQSKVEKEEQ